nr:hypothetical protein [Tanacetum cinerariifolium]
MANFLPRLQKLATATKSTMMGDQVLVLIENELDKEFKFEEKFRELSSEMVDAMKNRAEYIEELEYSSMLMFCKTICSSYGLYLILDLSELIKECLESFLWGVWKMVYGISG